MVERQLPKLNVAGSSPVVSTSPFLPTLPSDKDYQLWLIKNNTPVNAGIFSVSSQDDKFFKIEQMADISEQSANAFAVTMEPKGGMPQPTGDMYLMGKMQ